MHLLKNDLEENMTGLTVAKANQRKEHQLPNQNPPRGYIVQMGCIWGGLCLGYIPDKLNSKTFS